MICGAVGFTTPHSPARVPDVLSRTARGPFRARGVRQRHRAGLPLNLRVQRIAQPSLFKVKRQHSQENRHRREERYVRRAMTISARAS